MLPSDTSPLCTIARDLTATLSGLALEPLHNTPSSDIYRVHLQNECVVLKVVRQYGPLVHEEDRVRFRKQVARELEVWSVLAHPNILPIVGFCSLSEERVALVSRFMEGGSALSYVCAHPEANVALLCGQTAEGLRYLHNSEIIHGDLKGTNVLIDISGECPRALICDFGSSRILNQSGFTSAGSGTIAWTARELLTCDGRPWGPTKASDIWSLGMAIYELYTHAHPFGGLKVPPYCLMQYIARGGLPSRPSSSGHTDIDTATWKLLQCCWLTDPAQRPSAAEIRDHFHVDAASETELPTPSALTGLQDTMSATTTGPAATTSRVASLVRNCQDYLSVPSTISSDGALPKGLTAPSAFTSRVPASRDYSSEEPSVLVVPGQIASVVEFLRWLAGFILGCFRRSR